MAYEAEEILSRNIIKDETADKRYWNFHPKGKYTVSSGYELMVKIMNISLHWNRPESSNKSNGWWKQLWGLKIPPKLKIFWWQVAWDILPIEGNLESHHVPVRPTYYLCGYSRASMIHSIFLCTKVRKAWRGAAILLPAGVDCNSCPIEFLEDLYHITPISPLIQSWL